MKIRPLFASISLGASVDQQTGHLSVFDVVEEVRTPTVPIHMQSMAICLVLAKTGHENFNGKILIHIFTPDGKQAVVGNGEMAFPADQKKMKAVFRFGGFPLMQFGDHRFVLSILDESGQKKVAESLLDFEVVQVTQVAHGNDPGERPPMAH